jgi:hypothetical protein
VSNSRQDVAVEAPASLVFSVEKSKIRWGTYLQDMLRARGSASSEFQSYSGRGPSVVVRNGRGEKRVVAVTTSTQEARERAGAMEADYQRMGPAAWCERYDVPLSFVSA